MLEQQAVIQQTPHDDGHRLGGQLGQAGQIGGTVRAFVAGDRHHLALAAPLDDHYMGGLVDKYFGQHAGVTYWALRADVE